MNETLEDLEVECEELSHMLSLEVHKLFPELGDEDMQLGVIGRTLFIIPGPVQGVEVAIIRFGPDSLTQLGLDREPPE